MLVISDGIAGLSPREASEVIGTAFAEQGAQVAVIPVGVGGAQLADALQAQEEPTVPVAPHGLPELRDRLTAGPGRLVLDLNDLAIPPLAELTATFSGPAVVALSEALAGRELVAVVPRGEHDVCLTGLNGRIAALGRERGADLAETITLDGRAEAWAGSIGVDPTIAGTGALGGVGAVVAALGGRCVTGLDLCLEDFRAHEVAIRADVVVTGAPRLDFHDLGGPVVKAMSAVAAECQRPLVAVAGRTYVSARELRLAGIEAAYSVLPGAGDDDPSPEQLLATARKVATTWRW